MSDQTPATPPGRRPPADRGESLAAVAQAFGVPNLWQLWRLYEALDPDSKAVIALAVDLAREGKFTPDAVRRVTDLLNLIAAGN